MQTSHGRISGRPGGAAGPRENRLTHSGLAAVAEEIPQDVTTRNIRGRVVGTWGIRGMAGGRSGVWLGESEAESTPELGKDRGRNVREDGRWSEGNWVGGEGGRQ